MPDQTKPTRAELDSLPFRISLEAANRAVGLIALLLPFALLGIGKAGLACVGTNSLSEYYYTPLGGDVFTGALFVIGVLLLFFYTVPKVAPGTVMQVDRYKGHSLRNFRAARTAGAMAFLVALFPAASAGCELIEEHIARGFVTNVTPVIGGWAGTPVFNLLIPFGLGETWLAWVHYGAATVMFGILAFFALAVFPRDQSGQNIRPTRFSTKWWRNQFYRFCGLVIVACMLAMLTRLVSEALELDWFPNWDRANLTFWCESLSLIAFGASWSMKGRVFRQLRDPGEVAPTKAAISQARAA